VRRQRDAILATYRANARPIIQQMRQTQSDLGDKLLGPGDVQATDLQGQLQQISDLRAKLLQLSAQATVDIRNLLKPEQLAAAAQTKTKLKDVRSQMRQLMGPGPQR
jgi:Spy/CpxP family protein refolding chaperone